AWLRRNPAGAAGAQPYLHRAAGRPAAQGADTLGPRLQLAADKGGEQAGGMKQKILVAMAMATDAKLLFLDEPTIGLDPVSRRQVWAAIKDWKCKGGSILLTTHYMDEAEVLSDYIVIID